MDPTTFHPAIRAALGFVKPQAELARRCGVKQQTISKLLKREITVTPKMAVAISRATDGRVSIGELCPELAEAIALTPADVPRPASSEVAA